MSSIKEIEEAIEKLPPEGLAQFRAWFSEFDAALWDRQLEVDVAAGKLDGLADAALAEYRSGGSSAL